MKIVLYGNFAAGQHERIARNMQTSGVLFPIFNDASAADKHAALADADVLVTSVFSANDPPAPRIRLLQSSSAGIDRIDLACIPKNCIICNVFGHEIAIAEYIIANVLHWAVGLGFLSSVMRNGTWTVTDWIGGPEHGEAYGSTIGIVGFGRIGREVAIRAKALGMRVAALSAWRSSKPDHTLVDLAFETDEASRFIPECDYFAVCAPLNDATRGLVNTEWFARMKANAVVIHVGRGDVIEEAALYEALKSRRIRGASIDVWYKYPPASGEAVPFARFPFHDLDNIVMTPHASGRTPGTWDRRYRDVARNIDAFARGEPLMNVLRS
jgi:phosphoglycerate dehydrogenase-like enzyme